MSPLLPVAAEMLDRLDRRRRDALRPTSRPACTSEKEEEKSDGNRKEDIIDHVLLCLRLLLSSFLCLRVRSQRSSQRRGSFVGPLTPTDPPHHDPTRDDHQHTTRTHRKQRARTVQAEREFYTSCPPPLNSSRHRRRLRERPAAANQHDGGRTSSGARTRTHTQVRRGMDTTDSLVCVRLLRLCSDVTRVRRCRHCDSATLPLCSTAAGTSSASSRMSRMEFTTSRTTVSSTQQDTTSSSTARTPRRSDSSTPGETSNTTSSTEEENAIAMELLPHDHPRSCLSLCLCPPAM